MTIRIAVIGAGLMGADHARIVAQDLPGAELRVVCDMDIARARVVAGAHGAADVANDPFAVIARTDVDAVIIASPDVTMRRCRWPVSGRVNGCCVKSRCRNHPLTVWR